MLIGEVAARTGVTRRTLRFYEEKGLLDRPNRMKGGFRRYSEDDVRRVREIVELKRLLGLRLNIIKRAVEAVRAVEEVEDLQNGSFKVSRITDGFNVLLTVTDVIEVKAQQLQAMRERWQARLERYLLRYAATAEAETPGTPVWEERHVRQP